MHIGINATRLHLLAVGMKAATRALKTKLINQRNFWNESLQRALFAREVAKSMKLDPGLAFLGGLLQDYLLPVLTNNYDKQYLQFLDVPLGQGKDLTTWERETFGFDHAAAGAHFAAQWHFPPESAVRNLLSPFTGIDASGNPCGVLQIVSRCPGVASSRSAAPVSGWISDAHQS